MTPTITTTLSNRSDCAKLAALDSEIHPDAWSDKQFRVYGRKGGRHSCHYIRGIYSPEVLGYACVLELRHCIVIERFGVSPHYRMVGVGRQLMECCVAMASMSDKRFVRVIVGERNKDALRFLWSIGFRARAVQPDWFDGEDGVAMFFHVRKAVRR